MPIQLFIDAQENNYISILRTFLTIKLVYINGKLKFDNKEKQFIEYILLITRKTLNIHIQFLINKQWLVFNKKTKYYQIKAFDKIREEKGWSVRLAFQVNHTNIQNIQAITGAVIYGYLHKDFWRKVKREKSVQIKECTYYFLSPKFNYKKQFAPVSIYGVKALFDISKATASRLKNNAAETGFIKLKKNYSDPLPGQSSVKELVSMFDPVPNLVYHNGKYRLQYIDTLYPNFHFKKRKSMKP